MIRCDKCKTKIKTHLWLVRDRVLCSPGCERNAKSSFEATYKALRKA